MRTQCLTRIAALLPLCGLAAAQSYQTPFPHDQEPRSNFWWQDFDGDELPDAFVVTPDGEGRLLRNRGDGTLADVTTDAGLTGIALPRFSAWEDFDGDGAPDLFVGTHAGPSRLFHNQGNGTFVEIGAAAGLVHAGEDVHASWLDYDANGRPDLHVRTRVESLLYRNLGNGLFERVDLGLVTAPQEPSTTAPVTAPATGTNAATPAEAPTATQPSDENGGRRPVLAPVSGESVAPEHAHPEAPASPAGNDPGTDAPPGSDAVAFPTCALTLDDLSGGGCLRASSVPQLGRLYPLSSDLFVEAGTGFVGLGTTDPITRLHVDGGQLVEGSGLGPVIKADNGFTGTNRGYLGVAGTDNFDSVASADWRDDEIGVAGISLGSGVGVNRGVLGHSNGAGVRGEYSGNPTMDWGELGRNGIGLAASGSARAGAFLGDVDVFDGQLALIDGDGEPAFQLRASSTGEDNRFLLYDEGALGFDMKFLTSGFVHRFIDITKAFSVANAGVSPLDTHGFAEYAGESGTLTVLIDADHDDLDNGVSEGALTLRSTGTGGRGGLFTLKNNNAFPSIVAEGGGTGQAGTLQFFGDTGLESLRLDGDDSTGATVELFDDLGNTSVCIDGDAAGAGKLQLYNGTGGFPKVVLDGNGATDNDGGSITLYAADGTSTMFLKGEGLNSGAELEVRNDFGLATILSQGDSGATSRDGGCLQLFENDGTPAADFCQSVYCFFDSNGVATIAFNRQTGIITSALDTASYGQRQSYGVQSSEVWLEDFGSGRLTNGEARVELDPILLEMALVTEEHPLKVFVTLTGDCDGFEGLSVLKGTTGFVVRELNRGISSVTFDYRVVAKRRGLESTRLEPLSMIDDDHEHTPQVRSPQPDEGSEPRRAEPAPEPRPGELEGELSTRSREPVRADD